MENTGTINAGAQGRVLMAAGDVYSVAIRNRGTVRAGNIELNGGNTGIVDVGGTLDASNHSGQGGTIKVLGEKVGLFGATLNASGTGGGGEILIGGNERGAGPEANSQFVYISQDSVVRADGIGYGNGGRVIVFGEQVARIYGTLGAQGGEFGGNGGFVETSGKQFLEVAANIQIGARNGVAGEYLVDPLDITVVRNADGDNAVSGNPFTPTGASSRITVGTILTALAGGNVTITTVGTVGAGTGTITWNANAILDISTISAALNRTLTLSTDPGGSILFNGVMSNTGNAGRVGLILAAGAGGNVTFNGVANTAAACSPSTPTASRRRGQHLDPRRRVLDQRRDHRRRPEFRGHRYHRDRLGRRQRQHHGHHRRHHAHRPVQHRRREHERQRRGQRQPQRRLDHRHRHGHDQPGQHRRHAHHRLGLGRQHLGRR